MLVNNNTTIAILVEEAQIRLRLRFPLLSRSFVPLERFNLVASDTGTFHVADAEIYLRDHILRLGSPFKLKDLLVDALDSILSHRSPHHHYRLIARLLESRPGTRLALIAAIAFAQTA